MHTIYKHTTPNGYSYIGQCKGKPESRWQNGFGYMYNGSNAPFTYAILYYGWDNITHEILEDKIQSQEDADRLERYYIDKYNTLENGYNMNYGKNVSHSYGKYFLICEKFNGRHCDALNNILNETTDEKILSKPHKLLKRFGDLDKFLFEDRVKHKK